MSSLVLSARAVFGPMFAFGMVATGLGRVFGPFTRAAIVPGLWPNLNNFLIGFGGGPVQHGINLLMMAMQIAIWHTGAWRWYSNDEVFGIKRVVSAGVLPSEARA